MVGYGKSCANSQLRHLPSVFYGFFNLTRASASSTGTGPKRARSYPNTRRPTPKPCDQSRGFRGPSGEAFLRETLGCKKDFPEQKFKEHVSTGPRAKISLTDLVVLWPHLPAAMPLGLSRPAMRPQQRAGMTRGAAAELILQGFSLHPPPP